MRLPVYIFSAMLLLVCCQPAIAQKMSVKVVNRQNSETEYSYQVPGNFSPRNVSYSVTGVTFSLLLPDGRIAVVNCQGKYNRKAGVAGFLISGMNGAVAGNIRSCRMPLVDDIQAVFKGKNAKLEWPVSVDGKKFESETYTILAVLEKDKESGNSHANAAAKTGAQ